MERLEIPKATRRYFWKLSISDLHRGITACLSTSQDNKWGYWWLRGLLPLKSKWVCDTRYKGLLITYAVKVFRRKLREGKREWGPVMRVSYDNINEVKYFEFMGKLVMMRPDADGAYKFEGPLFPKHYCLRRIMPVNKVITYSLHAIPSPNFGTFNESALKRFGYNPDCLTYEYINV